jgi:uncharacterized peroxidase-related enzyme
MPRLKVVNPASATGKVKEIFDGPLAGKHINIFKGMGNSAAALQAYLGIAGALKEGTLTDREREVIALVVGQANGCDYCVAAHTALGKMVGLTEAQTVEARKGQLSDPKLDALAKFVKAVHEKNGNLDDSELQAFKSAGYNDGHVAEVAAAYALNIYTNVLNHLNKTEVDLPAAPAIS